MLQPAEIFLDRSGEEIRRRTFTLTDPSGRELCLRPDLTIPICQHAVDSGPNISRAAFATMAWRSAISPGEPHRPTQFFQAGAELLGLDDRAAGETEILTLAVEALRAAGLKDFEMRIGDLALFGALVDALDASRAMARTPEAAFLARGLCRDALLASAGRWRRRAEPAGTRAEIEGAAGCKQVTRRRPGARARRSSTACAGPRRGSRRLAARSRHCRRHRQAARHFRPGARTRWREIRALAENRRHHARRAAGRDGSAAGDDLQVAGRRSGAGAASPPISAATWNITPASSSSCGRATREGPVQVAGGGRYDTLLESWARSSRSAPSAAPSAPNALLAARNCTGAAMADADPRHSLQGPPERELAMPGSPSAALALEQTAGARGYRASFAGLPDIEVMLLSASRDRLLAAGGRRASGHHRRRSAARGSAGAGRPHAAGQAAGLRLCRCGGGGVAILDRRFDHGRSGRCLRRLRRTRHRRRLRVATKYAQLTRSFFAHAGISDYRIVPSAGATEGAPAAGTAEVIVDITTTGATLGRERPEGAG